MCAINFNFIEELEGNSLVGYVPDLANSKSGVTIGCGFDIGQRKKVTIRKHFPVALAERLVPYCRLKGFKAVEALRETPLSISKTEASHINQYAKFHATRKLQKEWFNATNTIFAALCPKKQTVIASVAYQYGSLSRKAPKFWAQVTNRDWQGALENLRDFGDVYDTRRNKEADLLASSISKAK